jgi:hypothetical protein
MWWERLGAEEGDAHRQAVLRHRLQERGSEHREPLPADLVSRSSPINRSGVTTRSWSSRTMIWYRANRPQETVNARERFQSGHR